MHWRLGSSLWTNPRSVVVVDDGDGGAALVEEKTRLSTVKTKILRHFLMVTPTVPIPRQARPPVRRARDEKRRKKSHGPEAFLR